MTDKNSDFLDLINQPLIRGIIKFVPLGSLIIANFIVLLIFSHFFNLGLNNLYFWGLYAVGFLFSLITIRTNYLLHWKVKDKPKEKKEKKKDTKIPKIGLWNSFIISIKNLFFNILNDLFILTIIWSVIFAFLYFIGLINVPNNFTNLTTTIMLIGVFSGFFQYYIKNYKEQVSMKIVNSISKYLIEEIKSINFKDFTTFLHSLKDEEIKKRFGKKDNGKPFQKKEIDDLKNRITKIILDEDKIIKNKVKGVSYIQQIFLSFKIEPTYLFDYLDYYKEFKKQNGESLNKQLLKKCYKAYFERKLKKFKEKLNKEDLTEIKKIIFSSIIFFDEVFADLEKTLLEFRSTKKKELNDFRDFYEKFSYDCVDYMLDLLLSFKQGEDKNA